MPRTDPRLLALLGVAAVAGFQNRDKIRAMLEEARGAHAADRPTGGTPGALGTGGSGGLLAELGSLFGGGRTGPTLAGGLGELVRHLQGSGHAAAAESWVSTTPNAPLPPDDLERALGPDLLEELERKTGLSRSELKTRLSAELPAAVDRLTPQGRLPSDEEAERFLVQDDDVVLREPGRA